MNYNIVPTTGTRAKSLEKAYGSKCRKSRDDAGVVFHRSEGGPNYLRASFFAEHRGHRHSHDGLDPTDSKVALLRSHDKIGFVSRKSGRSLPLLLWRLPKSNAASATVLVDELGVDSLGHAADGLRR